MEVTSYLLGKKAGGGGSEPTGTIEITSNGTKNVKSYATANVNVQPNLQNKSVTVNTNGSTSVSADNNYDGLDTVSITANVQPDLETKSVTITENGTTTVSPTSGKDGLSSVSITTNVSGGGGTKVEEKNVNFYDYDGTLVNSYTKSEFLALNEMPSNPTHEGLVAQGWNWSLADAKAYVTKYDDLQIGQTYDTTDGKVHIFIKLSDEKSPYLGFGINGTATIEWGDNSTDTVTGSDTTTPVYTQHTYSNSGEYEIKISGDKIYIMGELNVGTYLFTNSTEPTLETNNYRNAITKVYLCSNSTYLAYAFSYCANMKYISIPKNITETSGAQALAYCYSLKHVNLNLQSSNFNNMFKNSTSLENISMNNVSGNYGTGTYCYCSSLKRLTLNDIDTTASNPFCNYCASLEKFTYTEGIRTTPQSVFNTNYNIKKVVFPKSLNQFNGNSPFTDCKALSILDFSKCTQVPTAKSVTATTFVGLAPNYKIIVPDSLYSTWTTTSGWSNAPISHYVKASEYVE